MVSDVLLDALVPGELTATLALCAAALADARASPAFVVAVDAWPDAMPACVLAVPAVSLAQSHPEFISLGRLSSALYKPDSGPAPHIAFVIAHRTANYLNHIGCRELSSRGFLVICFNTRFQNNESQVRWEETPLDVKAAVDFARRQSGITKVILFGHSGGGPPCAAGAGSRDR